MPKRKSLQPSIIKETTNIKKLYIDTHVLEEAKAYAEFVGITSLDETIEKALLYVFEDDAEWQKDRKKLTSLPVNTTEEKAEA